MNHDGSRALSDVYGKIDQLLLSYPDLAGDAVEIHKRYAGLFKAFAGAARFVILAQFNPASNSTYTLPRFARKVQKQLQSIMRDARLDESYLDDVIIEPLFDYEAFHRQFRIPGEFVRSDYFSTEWTQDAFVVLKNANDAYALLEPIQFKLSSVNKLGDQLMADYIAAQLDYYVKPFAFQLEGGNALVGDNYAFIGSDTLYKNWLLYKDSFTFQELTNHFRWSLGVNHIFWVGAEQTISADSLPGGESDDLLQLLPHIDMFITLGGKEPDGRELVLVAQLTEIKCFGLNPDLAQRFAAYFDRVALSIEIAKPEESAFRVERLPIILTGIGDLIPMSYNNCLIEQYDGLRKVYLPRYRPLVPSQAAVFEKVEQQVCDVFEQLGITVCFVEGNFSTRALSRGSLHCMAKVLKRSKDKFVKRAHDLSKPERFWIDAAAARENALTEAAHLVPFLIGAMKF